MERIDEIRAAAKEYGQRSIENKQLCEKLGHEIIFAFDRYVSSAGGLVAGVPPKGDWRPNVEYRDEVFSFYQSLILTLGEVELGICIPVFDNQWVRQVIRLRKEGDQIIVLITENESQKVRLPADYTAAHLNEVCERIFQNALMLFRGEVNVFVDGGGGHLKTIGFRA
jgi:hypothetical protein